MGGKSNLSSSKRFNPWLLTFLVIPLVILGIYFVRHTHALTADINGDGKVDLADLLILASDWHKTGATLSQGDINGDGKVNILDLSILAVNMGKISTSNACASTAHTGTSTNFLSYLTQPGDQVIDIPDGTYKVQGTDSTAHPATTKACKGWLILRAKDPGKVILDLSGNGSGLTLNGSRVMFVGIKTIKGSVFAYGPDLTFWYDDMSFFQTTIPSSPLASRQTEMNSYGYTKARILYLGGPRLRVMGTNMYNACSPMITRNNLKDLTIIGTHVWEVGPEMNSGTVDQCHDNVIGSEQANQTNLQFLHSEFEGRMEMESATDTSSYFSVNDLWSHDGPGTSIHTSVSYHGECKLLNNIYSWGMSGFSFESGTNCKMNSTLHTTAPPSGSISPAKTWQAANTYDSWYNNLY